MFILTPSLLRKEVLALSSQIPEKRVWPCLDLMLLFGSSRSLEGGREGRTLENLIPPKLADCNAGGMTRKDTVLPNTWIC